MSRSAASLSDLVRQEISDLVDERKQALPPLKKQQQRSLDYDLPPRAFLRTRSDSKMLRSQTSQAQTLLSTTPENDNSRFAPLRGESREAENSMEQETAPVTVAPQTNNSDGINNVSVLTPRPPTEAKCNGTIRRTRISPRTVA